VPVSENPRGSSEKKGRRTKRTLRGSQKGRGFSSKSIREVKVLTERNPRHLAAEWKGKGGFESGARKHAAPGEKADKAGPQLISIRYARRGGDLSGNNL